MSTVSQCVTRSFSTLVTLLSPFPILRPWVLTGLALLLLSATAYAAEVTLAWEPQHDAAEVGGYRIYYWQLHWETPEQVEAGEQTTYTLTGLESGQTYYLAVTAHDGAGRRESDYSNIVDTNGTIFAINVGGPAYVDAAGIHYEADRLFDGGRAVSKTALVAGTEDDDLYRSYRIENFTYTIPLPNGDYVVTLRFADMFHTEAGKRSFDVLMEGQVVLSNLDLVAEAGPKTAYDVDIPVRVTDGVLDIDFIPDYDTATVSAIIVTVPTPQVVMAINAGGSTYTDTAGVQYKADTLFLGGNIATSTASIAGTKDDEIYQTARRGNFAYTIPLPNGHYMVTLRFAELTKQQSDRRLFDVTLEGQEVVRHLDLVAEVGPKTAYDITTPVRVTDGVLDIGFHRFLDGAIVNAIVIETLEH